MAAPDSFGYLLAQLSAMFPPALLSGEGWERMLALTGRLPRYVVDFRFGFEFALGTSAAEADFCVDTPPGSRLAEYYASSAAMGAGPEAAALGAFFRGSLDPHSFLAQKNASVILEYDVAGPRTSKLGAPGFFFVPRGPSPLLSAREDPSDLVVALSAAAGRSVETSELTSARQLLAALPESSFVAQAGAMPGRDYRAIRLIVQRLGVDELFELLETLKWPGSRRPIRSGLCSTRDVASSFALSLDIGRQGVMSRLGLELFRAVEWHAIDGAGWKPFIDRLEELGWCLPGKADGLRVWPSLAHGFGKGGVYRIRRTINHFKIVFEGGNTTAKAYLGMNVQLLGTPAESGS